MKKPARFNRNILIPVTILFILLTIFSAMEVYAIEEGTASGTGTFSIILVNLFKILRFPTHTLLGKYAYALTAVFFFLGFLINCFLYALLIERIVYILPGKKLYSKA